MTGAVDVGLVVRRLALTGCEPEPCGSGMWTARCPVHRGAYRALLVRCAGDGSVSIQCRQRAKSGLPCSQAAIWEALGLPAQQVEMEVSFPTSTGADVAVETGLQPAAGPAGNPAGPGANGVDNDTAGESVDALDAQSSNESDVGQAFEPDISCRTEECQAGKPELHSVGSLLEAELSNEVAAAEVGAPVRFGDRAEFANRPMARSGRAGGGANEQVPRDGKRQARLLRRLFREVRLVRGFDDRFYAQIPVAGHYEVHELGSLWLKYWLVRRFRRRYKTVPSRESLSAITRAFEAEAAALETAEPVWVRVADGTQIGALVPAAAPADSAGPDAEAGRPLEADTSSQEGRQARKPELQLAANSAASTTGHPAAPVYYYDLGDSTWKCVEISRQGCRIIEHAPVLFRRARGSQPVPAPQFDGGIELLKKYLNVADEDYLLVTAWLSAALRPVGPYPVLVLIGEQGSGKSTFAQVARKLIDPNTATLKGPPSGQQDFMIQAHNTWILTYDNLSGISDAFSDSLCRTATGGGFSTRSLYSNDSETLFNVVRPIIITGIHGLVLRIDLIDRCLIPRLPAISDQKRRRESEFWAEFEADRPRLTGALLQAVAGGLRMLPEVDLPSSPRMADFAHWGEAVARGLGFRPGLFLEQYHDNRRAACESALEESEVAQAVQRMINATGENWRGTASELLDGLASHARPNAVRTAQWPKTAQYLSMALRGIIPQLRVTGIHVNFERDANSRVITISRRGLVVSG